jgi:hypothetical protein
MLKKLASMTSFHSELSISELAKLAGGFGIILGLLRCILKRSILQDFLISH